MTTSNELHVVFGTGAIGLAFIEELDRQKESPGGQP